MDKQTKQRLKEIREAMKKYGFDKILGQSAKNKLYSKDDDETHEILLDDEIPVKLRLMLQDNNFLEKHLFFLLYQIYLQILVRN